MLRGAIAAAAPGTLRALAAVLVVVATGSGPARAEPAAAEPGRNPFDTVVIDPGHGGDDHGARGSEGLLEKELVLDVAERLAGELRARGLEVVMTRESDVFVPLEARTSIANDARGDLFVSVHANASRARGARGIETFFASLESSDAEARALAEAENQAFARDDLPEAAVDPLVAILGDLLASEHMVDSQEFARLAQQRLSDAAGSRSRGVKQAPFVVLMGVQMPAVLVELGFVTHPREEAALREAEARERLARGLAEAVEAFRARYDARRGLASEPGGEP